MSNAARVAVDFPSPESPSTAKRRLLSLDVMRGMTVAAMILVNNNGDYLHAYRFMLHSAWNGCTATDVIFPGFLFMVGMSMSFSLLPRLQSGKRSSSFLPGILLRGVLLIVLGLMVNGYPYFHFSTLRYCGVLQRIALCFLFTSLLVLWGNTRTRAAAFCLLLGAYWIVLRYAPVPGYGYPVRDFPLLDRWKSLPAWLDRSVFPGHLYGIGTYDPEGLLSTLPAIANTLCGVLAGEWLRTLKPPPIKAAFLMLAGCIAILLGYAWSFALPFNKRLWTSSYALFAAGITCAVLAALYWVIDVRRWDKVWTTPWIVFGTNAIAAYIFSELLAPTIQLIHMPDGTNLQRSLMVHFFSHIPSLPLGSLAYSVCFVLACYLPVLWLYQRRIFIRV